MSDGQLLAVESRLIADSVFQQMSGKWCVVGIFDAIVAPSFPVLHHSLGLFLQLSGIAELGAHELFMIFMDSRRRQLAVSPKVTLDIKSLDRVATLDVGMQTNNLLIPSEGTYFIEVYFDGQPIPGDIRLEAQRIDGGSR